VNKRQWKKLVVFILLAVGLLAMRFVWAQDSFGIDEVNTSLGGSLTTAEPKAVITRIINLALSFLALIALVIVIIGGFLWMTSGGEANKIDKAKQLLKNGLIGLAIILASWAIVAFLITQFGGAIGGNQGCTDGATLSCGCGGTGTMVCSSGSWGPCLGYDCGNGGGDDPEECSTNPLICEPNPNICAPSDYCSDDCLCLPRGNLGDPCDGDLTNTDCDPDNNLCAAYLACGDDCTCFGPPVIAGVSPTGGFCENNVNQACADNSDCGGGACNLDKPNGAVNNFLTIFGNNFGEYESGSSQVIFAGAGDPAGRQPSEVNAACVDSWQNEQIIIAVPSGVSPGPIKVVRADGASDLTNVSPGPEVPDFQPNTIQRPGLCSLSPGSGILGDSLTYQGINLFNGDAYFGNYQANVVGLDSNFSNANGLSGSAVVPNIQTGYASSFVTKTIGGYEQKSNYLNFTKQAEESEGPYIMSFTPVSGNVGQYVTIQGDGFGNNRGSAQVFFSSGGTDKEAGYTFPDVCLNSVWRDNQIIVKVPAGLANNQNYLIKIKLADGTEISTQGLNPQTFNFQINAPLAPSLCKLEPSRGAVATPVSFWGEYFGAVGGSATARFTNNKNALGTVEKDGAADLLEVAVPSGTITGPVKIIKNSLAGNSLNFSVGACQVDADCGTQICCPASTYKKGRCEANLASCFIDIPTSVFQWNFSTIFTNTNNPSFDSCAGMAKGLGACQVNAFCPNAPGLCSPYAGGNQQIVGECDFSCSSVAGCNAPAPNNCSYNEAVNRCLKNGLNSTCDLPQLISYTLGGQNYQATQTCNADGKWEISVPTSCPTGWTRTTGNRCVNLNSNCLLCTGDFQCSNVNGSGRCVSNAICPAGAKCVNSNPSGTPDDCVFTDEASCDCCCRIGQSAQDCCAPLTCAGTCGSDTSDDNSGLGSCSGCAQAGTTQAQHDAACNCSGHTGQYCDTDDPNFSAGVCRDCAGLSSQDACNAHITSCCFDSNKTSEVNDDFCRGGAPFEVNPANTNFGYCAYYDCQDSSGDPALCASTTPKKIAAFKDIATCEQSCSDNPGQDYCSTFNNNAPLCTAETACCFDQATSNCLAGNRINGGLNNGYCAYYDCQTTNPAECDANASTTGPYTNLATCETNCSNPPTGAGLSCFNQMATSTDECQADLCNLSGFACLTESGGLGSFPTCGTCCCQPGQDPDSCITPETPNLRCQPDKGACSGASRGLCCGCSQDSDCGSPQTLGCGGDTCCQARPAMASTSPAHLASRVCRNAALRVNFNTFMDIMSFTDNVILLEERSYDNGVCPPGTFIAQGNTLEEMLAVQSRSWFVRAYDRVVLSLRRLVARFNSQSALAVLPDPGKLYCATPGGVSGENIGNATSLIFTPQTLLTAGANYYLIIKGDEDLNSQTGVLSLDHIGLNGRGYDNGAPGSASFVEGSAVLFNHQTYPNSEIIKFTTLSDQESKAGVCEIDYIEVAPESYLIQTTSNDLQENDTTPLYSTFDTVADSDKVFTAWAYSADNQILQPVTGYYWIWSWTIPDATVASFINVLGLAANKKLVRASNGATDGETQVKAEINMTSFTPAGSCNSALNCSCSSPNCPSHCCNAYLNGQGLNESADLYVFVCNNPWPRPVNGYWSPFTDSQYGNYGYKFYYCRDAGDQTTLDDLPAIANPPIYKNYSSSFLTCSSDGSNCAHADDSCGTDQNGDGVLDGICYYNLLKEIYFFREPAPQAGTLINAIDQQVGGSVQLTWQSNVVVSGATYSSFKIYYSRAGGNPLVKLVQLSDACQQNDAILYCDDIISGLNNDTLYQFKISVVSDKGVESALSNEKSATPTDQTPPGIPSNLSASISTSTIDFTWMLAGNQADKEITFRLYHGTKTGARGMPLYGESFDSEINTASLSLARSHFATSSLHYFGVSALDAYGNESNRSMPISLNINNDNDD